MVYKTFHQIWNYCFCISIPKCSTSWQPRKSSMEAYFKPTKGKLLLERCKIGESFRDMIILEQYLIYVLEPYLIYVMLYSTWLINSFLKISCNLWWHRNLTNLFLIIPGLPGLLNQDFLSRQSNHQNGAANVWSIIKMVIKTTSGNRVYLCDVPSQKEMVT